MVVFGIALDRFLIGPCSIGEHCPIKPGERYRAGVCHIDGCPRRKLNPLEHAELADE